LRASPAAETRDDEGSVVVEFVLVSILVIAIAAGIVQLVLTLHVRNMLMSCAAEGAHTAARHDRDLVDGAERTDWLISASLGDIPHYVTAREVLVDGRVSAQIEVTAPVPVLGLWGAGSMTVTAHAVEEVHRG
jgi:hypothetical protein